MVKNSRKAWNRKTGGFAFCFPREYISENDTSETYDTQTLLLLWLIIIIIIIFYFQSVEESFKYLEMRD